jgi:hypothetical protein
MHLEQYGQAKCSESGGTVRRVRSLASLGHADSRRARRRTKRLGWILGSLLLLGMLLAAPASAIFEEVATFAPSSGPSGPENKLLVNATGMAVNWTGAGGVPPGTVYAVVGASESGVPLGRVIRFDSKGEFREAWGWGVGDGSSEFQRCGPDGEASFPTCGSVGVTGEGAGQLNQPKSITVDQETGDVYVVNQRLENGTGKGVIQVFSADGSQIVAEFGEQAIGRFDVGGPESIAESPGKLHEFRHGLAVDSAGDVYISDSSLTTVPAEDRVMVFKPQSAGDYEHYLYAGRSSDIAVSGGAVNFYPENLAIDDADKLYMIGFGAHIYKFDVNDPTTPVCEYTPSGAGLNQMTINPLTSEVYYFRGAGENKLHQLGAACKSNGKFEEVATFAGPGGALALNPVLSYEPSRPPGIMYGSGGGGVILAPSEIRLPVVESESVSSVTASTAVLGAQIDPKGSPTRYLFQYLDEGAYQANEPAERFLGASEAPLGGGALGSGQGGESAGAGLSGLTPDTVYHYRVVATSHCEPEHKENVCEAVGPDQTFRTFPEEPPGLPDGRAYELVSPPQKNGGEVFPADASLTTCGECKPSTFGSVYPMQSSPDGEALVYEGFPFSEAEGATIFNEYRSERTATGWQTATLAPPGLTETPKEGYKAFNPQLTEGLIEQPGSGPRLSLESPDGFGNLFSQLISSPTSLSPLLRTAPSDRLPLTFKLTYADASLDLSRIFFEANDALTEATPFAPASVDGGAAASNLYEFSDGQIRLVNVAPGNAETTPGAYFGSYTFTGSVESGVQVDLSHAVSDDGSRVFWTSAGGQVFVRENGETTSEIPGIGRFVTASADGSKVLLGDGDLFNVDNLAEAPIDLTEGKGGFQGIVGQSEDLTAIYFVDTAALNEGENSQGAKAEAGKANLYSWKAGVSTFIAALEPESDGAGGDNKGEHGGTGDWKDSPALRTAEASPDGRWVAFQSRVPLTGYDNAGPCGLPAGSERCLEVFLYDSSSGRLICASCNPTGEKPLGLSVLRVLGGSPGSLPQPRYVTNSGRLYFDSRDSLSASDTNIGVEDVYQYEPVDIGSCQRQGGCVSLISAGHEAVDSNFLAMDATGKNVFFTTRDQLSQRDRDDLLDVYDAREGGGIAAETETARSECQGESCQRQITAPNDATPASSSFEGAGNLNERKAKKTQHKKHKHAKKAKKKKAHRRSSDRAVDHHRGGAK